jgi:hypothetical protein
MLNAVEKHSVEAKRSLKMNQPCLKRVRHSVNSSNVNKVGFFVQIVKRICQKLLSILCSKSLGLSWYLQGRRVHIGVLFSPGINFFSVYVLPS